MGNVKHGICIPKSVGAQKDLRVGQSQSFQFKERMMFLKKTNLVQ